MANNIKDISPNYEYGSNRTTQTQIQTDAGISGSLGLQMLQTTSVRVAQALTYPSRLPASDPAAFQVGPQGQITMSSDLYPASFYAPAPPPLTGQIEIGPIGTFRTVEIKGRGSVDPANFFYLTSDTKVQDPLNVEAPAGISTPPTGTMGFFPVNKVPMGWITLGGATRYIYKRAYTYRYLPTNTILSPSDPLIGSDPANCIPAFANTEYTAIYNILKSWDLVGLETASMYELVFATKNPFSGYFVRTANPTFEGIAQNTHPFETEGQYMSDHSHDGYTYPNYASPINTYHASSKLPLVDNYLIDDLPGSKVPDTTTVNWSSGIWKGGATANSGPFSANNDLGHDIRLYSYRKTNGSVLVYDSEEEPVKPVNMNPITWIDGRQNELPTILNWNENIDLTIDIKDQFSQLSTATFEPLWKKGNYYASQFDYIALEYCHPTIFGKYDYFGKLEPVANEQIQYELYFEKCTGGAGPVGFTIKFWNWKGTRLLIIDNGGPEIEKAFRGIGNQWEIPPTWNNSIKICDLNIYDIYRYAMLFGIKPNGYGTYLPSKLKIWIRPNVNGVQFTNTHDLSLVYKDLTHVTHDPELKEDYLKKVLPAGIYHIANNTRSTNSSRTYANRKWNPLTNQFEPSPSIHTIEIRSLDNSLNLDKGRTSYHVERVNRWNNADTDYYNRRGFYEPHLGNLVYANSDFGVANTNQRIGTSYMFNYRYTFGSEWGQEGYTVTPPNVLPTWAHDAGSVFAQSTLKDVAPFTVIDHANIQHSVINYDTHVHTRIKTYHRSLVDRRLERKQSSPILGWQRNPSGYVRTIGPEGGTKTSTSAPSLVVPKKSRWVIKKDFSEKLASNKAFPTSLQGDQDGLTVGSGGITGDDKPTGFPYKTWDKDRFKKLNSLPNFNQLWNANPDGTITANYSTDAEDGNPIETGGTKPSADDPTNTPGISFQQGARQYHVPNWRFRRLRATYQNGNVDSDVEHYSTGDNSNLNVNSTYCDTSDPKEYDYLGGGVENEISRFLGIREDSDPVRATKISDEGEGDNVQKNKVWMHIGLPSSYRFENSLLKPNPGYTRKRMRGLASYKSSARLRNTQRHHNWDAGAFHDAADGKDFSWGWFHNGTQRHEFTFTQHWSSPASGDFDSGHSAFYPYNMSDQSKMYSDNGGRRSPIQAEYAGDRNTDPHKNTGGANYAYSTSGYADTNVRHGWNRKPLHSGSSKGANPSGVVAIRRNDVYDTNQTGRYGTANYPYNHVTISGPYGSLSSFNTLGGDSRAIVSGQTITPTDDGSYNDGSHFGVRVPEEYKYDYDSAGNLTNKSNLAITDSKYKRRNERAGEQVERKSYKDGKRSISGSTYGTNPWVFLNHVPYDSVAGHTTPKDHLGVTSNIPYSGQNVSDLSTFNLPEDEVEKAYRYLDRYNPEDQRNLYAFLSDYYSAYDIATEDYAVNNYTYKNPYFADARKQKQYRNYTAFRVRSDRYLTVNTKHNLSSFKDDFVNGYHQFNDERSHRYHFFRGHFQTNFSSSHVGDDYGFGHMSIFNRGRNDAYFNVQTGKYRHYHPKDVMDFSLKQSLQSNPQFYAPCHITRSDELTEDPYRLTFLNTGSSGPLAQRTTTVGGHEHDLIYANTTFRGDTEFRPINIALVPCIKV